MLLLAQSDAHYEGVQDCTDVDLVLTGRCLISSGLELACYANAISPDAISFITSAKVAVGEPVVVYLSAFGRFRGLVVRQRGIILEMELQLPRAKREKLSRQLSWYLTREDSGLPERRLHERIVPLKQVVTMRDGHCPVLVRIDDISSRGANISTGLPPLVGAEVIVDETPAVVVRTFEGGFACEFVTPFDLRRLDQRLSF